MRLLKTQIFDPSWASLALSTLCASAVKYQRRKYPRLSEPSAAQYEKSTNSYSKRQSSHSDCHYLHGFDIKNAQTMEVVWATESLKNEVLR